ncbi:hypothetical protein [Paracoccus sediminilitoris]|uniref:hypothetical protein n=1 Tax=Paracoccus sediminilitoris TaxID=2202419 RepID=UPI002D78125D|nr:hypothetical protein [Paracoccus sediminilitoris]
MVPHLRKGDLLETVREVEPDLRAIVIGKRGESADFATGDLDSNLERIARVSKVPVIVALWSFKPITKVLVAFDGSASAMKAIERMSKSLVFEGPGDQGALCRQRQRPDRVAHGRRRGLGSGGPDRHRPHHQRRA